MSVAWQFVSAVVTTTRRGVITMRSECRLDASQRPRVIPVKTPHTFVFALSQCAVIYFAVGKYYIYFMFAVALLKTAAHVDYVRHRRSDVDDG